MVLNANNRMKTSPKSLKTRVKTRKKKIIVACKTTTNLSERKIKDLVRKKTIKR